MHRDSREISLKPTSHCQSTFHLPAWGALTPSMPDLTWSLPPPCFGKSACSMPIMGNDPASLPTRRGSRWVPSGSHWHRQAAAYIQVNTVIFPSTSLPQQQGYELIVRSCLRACD